MKRIEVKFEKGSDRVGLIGLLVALGYQGYSDHKLTNVVKDIVNDADFITWPVLVIKTNKTLDHCKNFSVDEYQHILWPQDSTKLINLLGKVVPDVVLNSSYTAIINADDKYVSVGCQNIPFANIEALYKAIKSLDA